MLKTIASIFRSSHNVAQILEQGTEQALDEVTALRARRQLTNEADLAELTKEYADAGLGELKKTAQKSTKK
ncbi:MAG: hypothetical protein HRU18_02820 [Pseudoalteromonas sp.]|uniref:hypothetical protein n=1 Tax=Pseudoalteromonas sp. TaxID=53249 RepID=UPI001D3B5F78|nr:hypothetical protein [Pseudoalteromonas sp.]NRA77117.1 hypothetical protein [Pseudoalteromonas sp.]